MTNGENIAERLVYAGAASASAALRTRRHYSMEPRRLKKRREDNLSESFAVGQAASLAADICDQDHPFARIVRINRRWRIRNDKAAMKREGTTHSDLSFAATRQLSLESEGN
jgi:hypothetical protein